MSETFVPARGLGPAHAQTIGAYLLRRRRLPALRRERWETPDGDFVDVDILDARAGRPALLVLHGLEGSSRAGYVAAMLRGAAVRGWGATALNFRSCSGEPNRLLRAYHSGETGDPRFVVERMLLQKPARLLAVGFSLGGNVLLRLLSEYGAASPFARAAAMSVPFDLAGCARALDRSGGLTSLYRLRFLRTLRRKALRKAARHPGRLDEDRIRAARGIADFDDAVTAPVHGFQTAADYYAACSSGPVLGAIHSPTLLLSAQDDPLVPFASLPREAFRNPALTVLTPEHGGHVGFVSGSLLRPRFWGDEAVLSFLQQGDVGPG